jgi:hypothetical protein
MATLETQKLDSIIASRRSLLMGASALAAAAIVPGATREAAAAVPSAPADTDILNFALNLEYLEAQFYTIATEGVTADKSTQGSAITLPSGSGSVTFRAGAKTTFTNAAVGAYAFETALEERKHVLFLQSALGSAAVAQPAINLQTSFTTLGTLIGAPTFDPFTTDLYFLLGAFIFEDVGVTAYHGGALGITNKGKAGQTADYLTPAAGIHAVEAYHAGLVRTTLALVDAGLVSLGTGNPGMGQAISLANSIANVRATLDGTVGTAVASTDTVGLTGQDDFGLSTYSVPTNGTTGTASRILDQGRTTSPFYSNFIGFHRTYQQVLNIVYGNTSSAAGLFFPSRLNGNIN